jgi:hypothetical protein
MNKPKPLHDVVSRPAAKPLGQNVPAGVARLLGDDSGRSEETAIREVAPARSRRGKREAVSMEPRVTFALRYRQSYMDRLEQLYLRERASRRRLAKADLVEEALDLVFKKYGLM